MSGKSRKGLKREGMRAYRVTGPAGTFIIERERPWRFVVRPLGWPRAPGGKGRQRDVFFQNEAHRTLTAARAFAEARAGLA